MGSFSLCDSRPMTSSLWPLPATRGMPAASSMPLLSRSFSCVSILRSRSIWSISCSSRSSTTSSFSDSVSSAWMCETLASARSCALCSASISSCCLSNACLDSSINSSPSLMRSGPGVVDSHSLLRAICLRPRYPLYTRCSSVQASTWMRSERNSSLATFMRHTDCNLAAASSLPLSPCRRAFSLRNAWRPKCPLNTFCTRPALIQRCNLRKYLRSAKPRYTRCICCAE
mmetsp:Transcript_27129/g.60000  ORF Transcript_27129/g.60000 Transcript_27129/m.60000 type:complete len:229 (+) Transcript_27129:1346-2032(+)